MTNTRRFTVVAIVAVALLAITATAFGAKPDKPGKPDRPPDEHPPGMTCVEARAENTFVETDGFEITITDGKSACIDWTTTSENYWQVTVEGPRMRQSGFSIRDSHPGDFCWNAGGDSMIAAHTNGPLADNGPIPISRIDACGEQYSDSDPAYVFGFSYLGKPPVTLKVEPYTPAVGSIP